MAKLFLIIICVCTVCVQHLVWAQIGKTEFPQHMKTIPDIPQNHRHDIVPRQQSSETNQQQHQQQRLSIDGANNLEYGNRLMQNSNDDVQGDVGNKLNSIENSERMYRKKRHAAHSHSHAENLVEMNPNTDAFIQKLFKNFTNGDGDTMNLIQFENMMKTLNLSNLMSDLQFNQHQAQHHTEDEDGDSHENHAHSNEKVRI